MKIDNPRTNVSKHVLQRVPNEQQPAENSHDPHDSGFGRRVESDQSWSVYHVFTGEPAQIEGQATEGLNRRQATEQMVSLNEGIVQRRRTRKSDKAVTRSP